jgi:hypothetical protein
VQRNKYDDSVKTLREFIINPFNVAANKNESFVISYGHHDSWAAMRIMQKCYQDLQLVIIVCHRNAVNLECRVMNFGVLLNGRSMGFQDCS